MIENVKITKTTLGYEGHNILTFYIHTKGDGFGISIGGYALDDYNKELNKRIPTKEGFGLVLEILNIVGVRTWEELEGKHIRIDKSNGLGRPITKIGNLMENKWLDFEEYFKEGKLEEAK